MSYVVFTGGGSPKYHQTEGSLLRPSHCIPRHGTMHGKISQITYSITYTKALNEFLVPTYSVLPQPNELYYSLIC